MPSPSKPNAIRLKGVRQNNLKGFDLDIPIGELTVVTGLSGTGKSSLVFETLHAEGQRRYVETFSTYTRQFMEMLDRPDVDSVENIRPSIAIEQGNTVKTSRSTVGTMTELCDYFKVWFSQQAQLFDPETGEAIEDDNPQSIWRKARQSYEGQTVLVAFAVKRPEKLKWQEIFQSLQGQGYARIATENGIEKLAECDPESLTAADRIFVLQDRIRLIENSRNRFIEAARTALHFGKGEVYLLDGEGAVLNHYSEGLHAPGSDRRFRSATPGLFSFNSPLGACQKCRGFGRVIEIDYNLALPDHRISLAEGAIRPFHGAVYSESQKDLMRACKQKGIRTDIPYAELSEEEKAFVIEGEPGYGTEGKQWPHAWYGVRNFFSWLESNTYKMHVRVFLSKYRAYVTCPACGGARLQPEALNWKWRGYTLPALYQLPIGELLPLMQEAALAQGASTQSDISLQAILNRLSYLDQVGLDYLTLDRASRSLSGGEVERVNLTACLGTGLVDTLFVLDEPSVGLHARDIDRLVDILQRLARQGNTVVVVEHDEAIMRAADYLIELGPEPGRKGGEVVFAGRPAQMSKARRTINTDYLLGRRSLNLDTPTRKITQKMPSLHVKGATKHNLQATECSLPLQRLVALSGVSGSGKSTLLNNVIYQGLRRQRGLTAEDPAEVASITSDLELDDIALVDQSPVSRTPRSNPALYSEAWDPIRDLYARTDAARSRGFTAAHFSFNSGDGRCPTCEGLGRIKVEMQFMADVYLPCDTCGGKRFKPEILDAQWNGQSVADLLEMTVTEAAALFGKEPKVASRLQALVDVGLGYLTLGQPLNTLSGGESQRLKLVKYLARLDDDASHCLLLLDEPTTGLHRHDVGILLKVLQRLVERGHSLCVIEHHMDVLKAADWIIEMGPEAGSKGGQVTFAGLPEKLIQKDSATAPYLAEAMGRTAVLKVAEAKAPYRASKKGRNGSALEVIGAREHNLRDLSVSIPHHQITVVTGVSGSGKSSLAFDIVFAEGQRRFMESMSAWARQYVEQMPRPNIDELVGIPPTVAIEQRITRGTRKSTVATITEVAQYLRLLYARIGVPHSLQTGEPLVAQDTDALLRQLFKRLEAQARNSAPLTLLAPLVRGRKGHYQPLADWAAKHGYDLLQVDGDWVRTRHFKKLDRYREHDLELGIARIKHSKGHWILDTSINGNLTELDGTGLEPESAESLAAVRQVVESALKLGKGACLLVDKSHATITWLSTERTDPLTGESYPELDPKHFSWNSSKGWCPVCRGHGQLWEWMQEREDTYEDFPDDIEDGQVCPACEGARLNPMSRAVRLMLKGNQGISLPELLRETPAGLLIILQNLKLDRRGKAILADILPEIQERLGFMQEVGLHYLTLDRATNTLSGGEAQRIRLSAQLGSNLSGVLYVLDEPSIGLHARDNSRLINTLQRLRQRGNTLLVVEHDEDTMRAADRIIDLGPGAGRHGGELLANGTYKQLLKHKGSLTGQYLKKGLSHPLRGQWRSLPTAWKPKGRKVQPEWLALEKPTLRNLKGDSLALPKERLIMVCGPSGAGKSTLVRDCLLFAVESAITTKSADLKGTDFQRLRQGNSFRKVIEVDQNPIGKTPRSTPATYIGAFDTIRQFFASLPEAQIQGFTASSFSFNTKGGRCETCKGAGRIKLEMNFLPDTYTQCEDCNGTRYGQELSEVRWKDKNIADILAMTFEEAATFLDFHTRLQAMMQLMVETGLGYLTLGQSSPTLSGGEAQRLKLVSELAKGLPTLEDRRTGSRAQNLYILEEPTIGLHFSDCERLIELLQRMVDQGHTVIVTEHNVDLLAEADYIVELGPDGGEGGGRILYQGALEGILKQKDSPTAPYLKSRLTPVSGNGTKRA